MTHFTEQTSRNSAGTQRIRQLSGWAASVGAFALLAGCSAPENVAVDTAVDEMATLSRSVNVNATPDDVWSAIGGFCAVPDWHPAIGSCALDGTTPPTRTMVTVDGAATFVELETARDDAAHTYSYSITSSPLPITHYEATIRVDDDGSGLATITWSSEYLPDDGAAAAMQETLTGIYDAGLGALVARYSADLQSESDTE